MAAEEPIPFLDAVRTSRDLVYATSNTPALLLCRPCHVCSGTGRDQNQQTMYDPTRTLEALACKACQGLGHFKEYVTLHDLYLAFLPYMLRAFEEKIPELVSRLPYEIVREIMES